MQVGSIVRIKNLGKIIESCELDGQLGCWRDPATGIFLSFSMRFFAGEETQIIRSSEEGYHLRIDGGKNSWPANWLTLHR